MTDRSDKEKSAVNDDMIKRLSRISREMHDLTAEFTQIPRLNLIDFGPLNQAFINLLEALKSQPAKLTGMQADLTRRIIGVVQEIIENSPAEKLDASVRFKDPAWGESPYFDLSRRLHAALAGWMRDLPETTPGVSDKDVHILQFWAEQFTAATSPANYVITNPRVMKELISSGGDSLQRGLNALARDTDTQTGRLQVRQSDIDAFTIGEDVATTPGKVVFKNELIELIAYNPTTKTVSSRPILILPPWINKYYVLDLRPDNSFVAWLRDQGVSVYMISWRSGCAETSTYDWDDYITKGALAAIEFLKQRHQQPVNAVGYCAGGTLLSTLIAWMGRNNLSADIASVSLLAAQTDYEDPGDLSVLLTPRSVELLEAEINRSDGLMRGEIMADAFNLLRPNELIWRHIEDNYLLGKEPAQFDLLFWNADQTHIPGPLHLANLRRLYLENALSEGKFDVFGDAVGLHDIVHPIFIQATDRDHISPAESVYRGARKIKSPKTFVLSESGHIAGVVNPPSAGKYGYRTGEDELSAPNARIWSALGTHHDGSWWPHWLDWLSRYLGDQVEPVAYSDDLAVAPGDYVRVRINN